MADDGHADDRVAGGEADAAHAGGIAGLEDADRGGREPDRAAHPRDQHHVVGSGRDACVHELHALGQLHRDLAVAHHVGEVREPVAPHVAGGGGEHDLQVGPVILVPVDWHDRGGADAGVHGLDHVRQGPAARRAPALRELPGLELVDHAAGGEDEQRRMRVGDEEARHHIVVLGVHALRALAAAPLRAELAQRRALDVARGGDGHDHVLALDQVLVVHVAGPVDDLRPAGHGELRPDLPELVRDDLHDPGAAAQDGEVVPDPAGQLLELVGDLLDAKLRQALKPQLEDGAGLHL